MAEFGTLKAVGREEAARDGRLNAALAGEAPGSVIDHESLRAQPTAGWLAATLGLVLLLAVVGVVLAANVLTGSGAAKPPGLPPGPFAVGQDIPTSFGVVAVEHVEKISGVTAKALAGVTHGIQSYVRPDQQEIQATVTLTNLSKVPVAYSPTEFRPLTGEDHRPVGQVSSNLTASTLQPDANIDGRVSFIVPRDGRRLSMTFSDPGRAHPITIDLGRTSTTPAGVVALERQYQHHGGTR